ncbi:hypothetical protein Pint_19701 [Pistacia integerrima]|uniref:Uncharacterized protein n=1 Tax=Pistacia integerrima TaxID=434235 RepID=A0ACC0XCV0_9ROSI|nr:hypothetical protein Pint_19701 [Pistacia integerrima]
MGSQPTPTLNELLKELRDAANREAAPEAALEEKLMSTLNRLKEKVGTNMGTPESFEAGIVVGGLTQHSSSEVSELALSILRELRENTEATQQNDQSETLTNDDVKPR